MPRASFRKYSFYLISLFLIILFIVLNYFHLLNPVKGALYSITSPLVKNFDFLGNKVYTFFKSIQEIKSLREERETLLSEKLKLQSENNQLKEIASENDILRKELELAPREKYGLVFAQIISRDNSFNNQSFIIDKGENDNVKTGQAAIVSSGIIVGKVTEVYPHNSKVVLLVNLQSEISAQTQGSQATGILKGEPNATLVLDLIPQSEQINPDNEVITSGLENNLPPGLTIGKVKSVHQSKSSIFQKASIEPAVFYQNLKFVHIITSF
jgi:rod shape-determining protein MreC